MKSLILATLLAFSAGTVFAGNEGPQAAPVIPKNPVIAQVVQGGGLFRSGQIPVSISVDILANGQVQETKTFEGGKNKVRPIAKLAPAVLANLKKLVEETKVGELYDVDPDAPKCMDAPSTVYYAVHADGLQVEVSAIYNCKEHQKSNAGDADFAITNILRGLKYLTGTPY